MNKYKRILVPVDFSKLSCEAIDVAKELAKPETELHLVHVNQPQMIYAHAGGTVPPNVTEVGPTTQQKLEQLSELPQARGLNNAKRKVIEGTPASAIVDYAEAKNIDLIVMTTHGEQGVMRLLMGSVAEHVVRKAPCPVLTFKSGTAEDITE